MLANNRNLSDSNSSAKEKSVLFDKNVFFRLKNIDSFYFENGNFLHETEPGFLPLGVLFFIIGAFCLGSSENLSLFIRIILFILSGVFFVSGYLLMREVKIFCILNLNTNIIYKETRLYSKVLYRSKPIKLSDIIMFGIDHQRGHGGFQESKHKHEKADYYYLIASLVTGNLYFRKEETEKFKKESKIDGLIEKTALAYLTKDGKKGYFNNFSSYEDGDDINLILASAFNQYANIPVVVAKPNYGLVVKKIGTNFYKFVDKDIKPTILGTILKTIFYVFLIIVAFFLFGLLVVILT